MKWACSGGSGLDYYKYYFGTNASPAYVGTVGTSTTYTWPEPLQPGTTYYWKIEAVYGSCAAVFGPVWNFTTACDACTPTLTSPANDATGVALDGTMRWSCSGGSGVDVYTVYFGTSPTPPLVGTMGTSTQYTPGFTADTDYYWRVVASKSGCADVSSPTWHFRTGRDFGSQLIPQEPGFVSSVPYARQQAEDGTWILNYAPGEQINVSFVLLDAAGQAPAASEPRLSIARLPTASMSDDDSLELVVPFDSALAQYGVVLRTLDMSAEGPAPTGFLQRGAGIWQDPGTGVLYLGRGSYDLRLSLGEGREYRTVIRIG